jgi:thioredoxin 2
MADLVRHVVCPSCSAINRVPATRSALEAKCGTCHNTLFTGRPVNVDGNGFERHVARNDMPVVVDFWAPWCRPCLAMAPAYEQAASELEPHFRLLKVNADEEQPLMAKFGIRSIPTTMMFLKGNVVARTAGAMNARAIVAWAKPHGVSGLTEKAQ